MKGLASINNHPPLETAKVISNGFFPEFISRTILKSIICFLTRPVTVLLILPAFLDQAIFLN